MDILDLINDATKEANSFENHPAKELPLEERLLYLNGLSLVMNSDAEIDEEEKEYIRILIKSFELDESCLDDMVAFAQSPDKDTIQAFFRTFRRKPLAQLFLFDAYMMGMRDGEFHDHEKAVIDKISEQLEILKGTKRDIFDLFCHIKNKDWEDSAVYFSSHLLNPEHFKHLLDYFELEYEDVLNKTKALRKSRLIERVMSNKVPKWIPLKYGERIVEQPEHSEITADFVNLSFTYGMVIPFLQYLSDRREVRVFEDCIYYVNEGNGNELLLNLNNKIEFDQVNKVFSIPVDLENVTLKDVEKSLVKRYFDFLEFGVNVDNIAKCIKRHWEESDGCFPQTEEEKYLSEEIAVGDNGNFYVNTYGSKLVTINRDYYKVDKSIVDVLTSGKVRFTR